MIGHSKVQYLRHQISSKGVEVDKDKVKSMVNWPQPKDVIGLRGFLDLMGYYRRFIGVAFEQLKAAMTTIPVLALPDWSLPFVIETDASYFGLGVLLSRNGYPIASFSQKLSSRAQTKSIYEREFMAIVLVGQKWRHYLLGRKFTIISD